MHNLTLALTSSRQVNQSSYVNDTINTSSKEIANGHHTKVSSYTQKRHAVSQAMLLLSDCCTSARYILRKPMRSVALIDISATGMSIRCSIPSRYTYANVYSSSARSTPRSAPGMAKACVLTAQAKTQRSRTCQQSRTTLYCPLQWHLASHE